MDIYNLTRKFWNFSFENPEKISPWHSAIYFFAIEHCNRLWWKEKFWFPSQMVMEAVWIKNWKTYSKYLNDLVEWWFIKMIEVSKNQYSSNIIAIVKNTKATTKANTKALDKALLNHKAKHSQSTVSIDIQDYKYTNIQDNIIDKSIIKADSFWNENINRMQEVIKNQIELQWMIYKPWKYERSRIKNIVTWKDFWKVCENCWMTREVFVTEIISLASKLQYSKPINNASDLYENYAAVYNKALKIKNEILQPKRMIW